MNQFNLLGFLLFKESNLLYVTVGLVFLCISSGIIGCFFMLEKKSLVSDAVSHSMLPGLCLGFLLAKGKSFLFLLSGAFMSSFISILLIEFITSNSKLHIETATAIILSFFFGLGIFLLSIAQNTGYSGFAGLQYFLFGKAASLLKKDVINISILAILIIGVVISFYKGFKLITFDKVFGHTIGFPVKIIIFLLNSLTILSITLGVQCVGVVLMSAMLITPAAGARFWTNDLKKMIFISAFFGALSGYLGSFISYLAPAMPTGPWIVVIMSLITIFSFLFAPQNGILRKAIKSFLFKKRIQRENILKFLYQKNKTNSISYIGINEIRLKFPYLRTGKLKKILRELVKSNLLNYIEKDRWTLTSLGNKTGAYILKLHCLWEIYLTKYVRLKASHVHEDAESIEHILSPELEKELIGLVGELPEDEIEDKNF